jgi:DNA-directed RNA polymerase subunit beta'
MQGNFYNQVIDKKGLKRILSWFIENYGATRTSQLIEYFKLLGFHYATRAGLSLGFEDLKIPPAKRDLLLAAQKEVRRCENNYVRGTITAFERYQKLIDIWTTTSENLKEEVIKNFQKTPLNPLYMMAFSGARGNISQVRQLVGMRGLMSDSGGGIIDFPIRSNFREGLSVTEYVISCYGARKGLIDTALRTADSGYLTRRLVDVAHSIMVYEIDCGTSNSISVPAGGHEKNLLGRVLASTLRVKSPIPSGPSADTFPSQVLAWKNQDISATLAREIITAANGTLGLFSEAQERTTNVQVRSPLTCQSRGICQMCYGWNLAQGRFVSIGDAVGVLAAQSIGEPGTQLTMRTFHTGGIFSTDILDKVFVPHDGVIAYEKLPRGCKVRSVHGETGFFSLEPVKLCIKGVVESVLQLPAHSLIFAYPGKYVRQNDLCAEISRLVEDQSPSSIQMAESNNEIESEGSVKIVLSEIHGQVSFGTRGSSPDSNLNVPLPNEVWVLAGDTFIPDGTYGVIGDLMSWRGSRGRGNFFSQPWVNPCLLYTSDAADDPHRV